MTVTPNEAARHGISLRKDGQRRSAFELLSLPDVGVGDLARVWSAFGTLDSKIAEQLEIDAKYDVYLRRQAADVESYRRDESLVLAEDFDYAALPGLSNEVRHKLATHRPPTIGHAGRIDGITPAALTLLAAHVRRQQRKPGSQQPPASRHVASLDLAADRAHALEITPVSRETAARLDRFVALLLEWQRHTNLIASIERTDPVDPAYRGFAAAPRSCARREDLGRSRLGGGLSPGSSSPAPWRRLRASKVHLVESIGKKATFLREASRGDRRSGLVHAERIADFAKHPPAHIDVVTARALARYPNCLAEAYPLLKTGATGLFPKGQDVDAELTDAAKYWNIQPRLVSSRTDPKAQIVVVRQLSRRRS